MKAVYGAANFFLFNNATEATVSALVKIWQMNYAFIGCALLILVLF